MDRHILAFKREKETKGTWRYLEVEAAEGTAIVGTLYLRKAAMAGPPPERLRVTIEDGDTVGSA